MAIKGFLCGIVAACISGCATMDYAVVEGVRVDALSYAEVRNYVNALPVEEQKRFLKFAAGRDGYITPEEFETAKITYFQGAH